MRQIADEYDDLGPCWKGGHGFVEALEPTTPWRLTALGRRTIVCLALLVGFVAGALVV